MRADIGHGKADLIGACVQADATRYSGQLTFGAGVFVVMAAILAYGAALAPVKLERQHHRARVTAYWWHMKVVLAPVLDGMEKAVKAKYQLIGGLPVLPQPIEIPSAMETEAWEHHALLGHVASSVLAKTTNLLRRFNISATPLTLDNMNDEDPTRSLLEVQDPDNPQGTRSATRWDVIALLCEEIEAQAGDLSRVVECPPPDLVERRAWRLVRW